MFSVTLPLLGTVSIMLLEHNAESNAKSSPECFPFTVADDAPSPAPIANVVAVGEPVSTGGEPSSAPGPAPETTTKV
ncbi:hypothetical protein V6N11_046519 [Hibiscus sabdariffa]|uniref:Secreted protein n=1 Tax=Hibiscus sabdariffa TaxID=183260 RepID=A0ABR2P2F7_9ROSI